MKFMSTYNCEGKEIKSYQTYRIIRKCQDLSDIADFIFTDFNIFLLKFTDFINLLFMFTDFIHAMISALKQERYVCEI